MTFPSPPHRSPRGHLEWWSACTCSRTQTQAAENSDVRDKSTRMNLSSRCPRRRRCSLVLLLIRVYTLHVPICYILNMDIRKLHRLPKTPKYLKSLLRLKKKREEKRKKNENLASCSCMFCAAAMRKLPDFRLNSEMVGI